MRAASLSLGVGITALSLLTTRVAAAEDDIPTGNDPPRLKPVLVADGYWAFHDTPPGGGQATGMSIGATHHAFSANLVAVGAKLEHSRLMGQVVLHAGDSVDVLYKGPGSSFRHVQVASVGWRLGSDFWVEAGILPSQIGHEDFVSARNWSYTHAYVSDATPYYVAGARFGYRAHPKVTIDLTAFNGWWYLPTQDRENPGKAGNLHVGIRPMESLTVDVALVAGRENPGSMRLFSDVHAEWKALKWLSAAVEFWYGREQGFTTPKIGDDPGGVEDPSYHGAALWLRFAPFETTFLGLRGEVVEDESGILIGRSTGLTVPGRLLGATVTLGWQPHPAMLVRVEAIHRRTERPYFGVGTDAFGKDSYDTQSNTLLVSTTLHL